MQIGDVVNSLWIYSFYRHRLIVLVFGIYPMAVFFYCGFLPAFKDSFTHSEVLQSGIAVNADIIAAHQTSAWSGSKPICHRITFANSRPASRWKFKPA